MVLTNLAQEWARVSGPGSCGLSGCSNCIAYSVFIAGSKQSGERGKGERGKGKGETQVAGNIGETRGEGERETGRRRDEEEALRGLSAMPLPPPGDLFLDFEGGPFCQH
jgi:hypothetical protein